jgi:hypothetical protein
VIQVEDGTRPRGTRQRQPFARANSDRHVEAHHRKAQGTELKFFGQAKPDQLKCRDIQAVEADADNLVLDVATIVVVIVVATEDRVEEAKRVLPAVACTPGATALVIIAIVVIVVIVAVVAVVIVAVIVVGQRQRPEVAVPVGRLYQDGQEVHGKQHSDPSHPRVSWQEERPTMKTR